LLILLISVAGLAAPAYGTSPSIQNAETPEVLASSSPSDSGPVSVAVSCFGDSITHGYPYGLGDPLQAIEKTYPSILQSRLDNQTGAGHYVVVNHGVNGLKAEELRTNLQTQAWLNENPVAVLIMIGGNDLSAATSIDEFMRLAQETVRGVQDSVNIIKAHVNPDGGRPVVIVSAFPPNRLGVVANQGIVYYNGLLKGQLTGVDLFFSDNFDDLYDSTSGDAKPELMYDTVHPNDAGYALIAENWNTALVQVIGDILARTHALGLLREDIPADARVTPVVAAALPTHFDWRQKDGYNWMTSVKNQASCGSCVAFAAVGATEGQLKIQANNPSWNVDLSEQHLFSCGGGLCGWGWYISSALNRLRDYGTPDEACSPYQSGDGSDRSCPTRCGDGPDWQSRAYKISSWNWISSSPSAIEAALMNGPLVAAFDVYTDFFYYNGGVYRYSWGHLEGGHAIVIVGYDSNEQYWIVKNSWGATWGDGGYFKIAFGQVGIEQDVAYVRASTVTATTTVLLTRTSTSYAYGTTTRMSTSYTSTSTTTSTIPTVTTVVLVPLTVTSMIQSIQYLVSTLTTTVTSYSGTQTSTSTIPTVTTVVLVPLFMTSMIQSIQYLVSTLTTTVTSYTSTQTSTSTIVVPTTVTLAPSTTTSTVQTPQFLTSTGTTTVTSYTTTTVTSYTGTQTSTSTSVVYTTVTSLAGAGPSSQLAYLSFISLFAVSVGRRATSGKGGKFRQVTPRRRP
jgi:lysophospholipase L1-like esterase